MKVRNIEDLKLEEIDEEFLLEKAIEMGDELEVDTRQGSLYRDAADGHIIRAAKFFDDLRQVAEIISIESCTGDVLDQKMKERGLSRNPPEDTPARYYVDFVGAEPELGELVTCGGYFFTVDKLDGRYIIVSEERGVEMNNLVKGSPVIPEVDVDEMISATLMELAIPATDQEDDDSARRRLINKISGPDENGNINQITTWCESVEGVGRARVIPLWDGPMTVKGIIIGRDGGVPSQGVIDAVQDYIDPGGEGMGEGVAAIGQKFTAEAVQGIPVNIQVEIVKKAEASYSAIQEELNGALAEYCKSIALEAYSEDIKVRYNRVSAIITELPGVIDHEGLLINGAEENIPFTVTQIPVMGEVDVRGNLQ